MANSVDVTRFKFDIGAVPKRHEALLVPRLFRAWTRPLSALVPKGKGIVTDIAVPAAARRPFTSLPLLEFATVAAFVVFGLAWARPDIEAWSILNSFRQESIARTIAGMARSTPTRALEHSTDTLAWVLGHGSVLALGLVYGLEIAAKYLAARWALAPLVRGANGWLLATVAAAAFPSFGQWRGHSMAPLASAVFMLIALGAAVRLQDRVRVGWVLLGTAGLLLAMSNYEGLAACALVLPWVAGFGQRGPLRSALRRVLRSALPIGCGAVVYGMLLYGTGAMSSKDKYLGYLLSGPQPLLHAPLRVIETLYRTSYFTAPWTLLLLAAMLGCLAGLGLHQLPERKERIVSTAVIAAALIALPLLGLPFAENLFFLSDLERVGLPLGFGFFLLCAAAVARYSSAGLYPSLSWAAVLVAAMLAGTAVNAYNCYRPYLVQRAVLDQIKPFIAENVERPLLVRDFSGLLGDRYTFLYPDTLSQALSLEEAKWLDGRPDIPVQLCTPAGVDRKHPEMLPFGGFTAVPRCTDLVPPAQKQLVLDVRPMDDTLQVVFANP